MDTNIQKSIFSTIAYYQVFNFFLNPDEIYKYLHTPFLLAKNSFMKELKSTHWLINGYAVFNLKGKKETKRRKHLRQHKIKNQQVKTQESLRKMEIAKKTASLFKHVPSVKLIAVSGNLAMMNADVQDDIDLFIITHSGTVWITRFFASILLVVLGKKRLYGVRDVRDKICLNFFIDEDHLEMKKKTLYVAHEIAQMKVLCDKEQTHKKFLEKNSWMKNYLANWWHVNSPQAQQENLFETWENINLFNKIVLVVFQLSEPIARFLQQQYMKHRVTREIICEGVLMFHPRDYGREIMKKYRSLLNADV